MSDDTRPQKCDLLVYGIERKGLNPLKKQIEDRNYTLTFESFTTKRRFNEFDGVLLFQGSFESFEAKHDWAGHSYLKHYCDQDELDKRKKELQLLLQGGGFVCFLLCEPFIDMDRGNNFENTDLAKVNLNFSQFYRENFKGRATALQVIRDEFLRFFELYGAANTHFKNYNNNIDQRVLAQAGNVVVSMILWDERFFIPCLMPENTPERLEEFFRLLCDAIIAIRKKLQIEIPAWVDEFKFQQETILSSERDRLTEEIEHIGSKLSQYERYKRVLLSDDIALVESVAELLEKGFGLKIDTYDELREDIRILNKANQPIIFIEIKGTNRGVKRENINQADSHRERANLPVDFPTVLIMNTHIKNARNLAEKDQDIAIEQVVHATKSNVLILRTYDLLQLLELYLSEVISQDYVVSIFATRTGWLKVIDKQVQIVTE